MVAFITNENKIYYDADTIKNILNITKSKCQRELKKRQTGSIKYKNLFLYEEQTLLELMEKIITEKLNKNND